jgi:ABC-type glutathione transport system ATPase component
MMLDQPDEAKINGSDGVPAIRNAVTVEALVKEFGSRRVLDEVSFIVPANSITGLIGPTGAGKSTIGSPGMTGRENENERRFAARSPSF